MHENPINHKIRRGKHQPSRKQNAQVKGVLKQIDGNLMRSHVGEGKDGASTYADTQTTERMEKGGITNYQSQIQEKFYEEIVKQNQIIKSKIQETDRKITQTQQKTQKVIEKYVKLKQNQSNKMRIQVKKLTFDCKNEGESSKDWTSILGTSKAESRIKISQIRQRISRMDNSNVSSKTNKK